MRFCILLRAGLHRLPFSCSLYVGRVLLVFNSSLWDWQQGFHRERLLSSQGNVCCEATSGRHSFLPAPYGTGCLDLRGKGCCLVKGMRAVKS